MSSSRTGLIVAVVFIWLASLAGAYFLGKRTGPGGDGADGSAGATPRVLTNRPAGSAASDVDGGSAGGAAATGGEESGDGAAINVRALIAKVRSQMSGGAGMAYNPTSMMKLMAPMADLSEAQVREALEEVEATVVNPQQKVMFYSLLLGRLAETDGAGAMAYVEENLGNQGGFGMGVTMTVLGAWTRREPEAAWEWFVEHRDGGSSSPIIGYGQVSAVFSGLASTDIDKAFARLDQLDDLERTQAISGIAMSGAWDAEYREGILSRAESLPDDLRRSFHSQVVGQWAMMDPDEALDWIGSLPVEEQKPLKRQAATMLLMTAPKRAAGLMLENSTEEERPMLYSQIIGQWATRDPNGAGEWLNDQPQGPGLDMARASFARSVVRRDPVSAMAWAKTVENDDQRAQAIQQVYGQWKGKDAPAADAALDQSGLAAEEIEEIRRNAPKRARSLGAGGMIFSPQ